MCSLFIFDCISLDISSIFPCVLIRYWREISCRTKIQLLFYYCFVTIQILKAGDFHVTILIEKQPLYDTFSSPPLQRRRRCIWAKSSKFLPLVMILCLALSCAIQSTANRFGKQYWILRLHAVETKFCDLCLPIWNGSKVQTKITKLCFNCVFNVVNCIGIVLNIDI